MRGPCTAEVIGIVVADFAIGTIPIASYEGDCMATIAFQNSAAPDVISDVVVDAVAECADRPVHVVFRDASQGWSSRVGGHVFRHREATRATGVQVVHEPVIGIVMGRSVIPVRTAQTGHVRDVCGDQLIVLFVLPVGGIRTHRGESMKTDIGREVGMGRWKAEIGSRLTVVIGRQSGPDLIEIRHALDLEVIARSRVVDACDHIARSDVQQAGDRCGNAKGGQKNTW